MSDDGSPLRYEPSELPPLDGAAAWFQQYLSVPSEHCITVLALWAAHTHAIGSFYVTPRLIIDSAEPESGKTRVLELLDLIALAPIFTMNTTIAALYRRLAGEPRTILLDETDAIFAKGAAQNHEDLRALLNAGYKRGATVDRCVGDGAKLKVKEFPAFAAAALAGITGNMPPTITTRAVTIHMRRRAPGEAIAEFIEEDAKEEAAPVRESLSAWMGEVAAELKGARPVMPRGVVDRKAEVWRALLAVADVAGGDWPSRARAACKHFVLGTDPGELSLGVRLLADLRAIFDGHDQLSTASILESLAALEEAPWGDMYGKPIDSRRLARMLGKYGAHPKVVRIGETTPRGYTREALTDLWRRYLPPVSATGETSATPLASHVADVEGVALTAEDPLCDHCGEPHHRYGDGGPAVPDRVMTPLEQAAMAAAEEAAGLLADAQHALTLEGESFTLYDRATDAVEAYYRAKARAEELRKLADHTTGTYNAWTDA